MRTRLAQYTVGLAGTFYGVEQIPKQWLHGLQKKEVVERISLDLVKLVAQRKDIPNANN